MVSSPFSLAASCFGVLVLPEEYMTWLLLGDCFLARFRVHFSFVRQWMEFMRQSVAWWYFTRFLRDSGPRFLRWNSLLLVASPEEYRTIWLHWKMTLKSDFASSFRIRCNAGFNSGYMQATVYGGCLDEFPTDPEVEVPVRGVA